MLEDGSGLGGREQYRRTFAERVAIVLEIYQPSVTVAEVAPKHGVLASTLSSWRSAAKHKSEPYDRPAFSDLSVMADALSAPFDGIEFTVGVISVRVPENTTPKRIADVAHRLTQRR